MNKKIALIGRGTIAVNCLRILKKQGLSPAIIICDVKDSGEDTWTKSLLKEAKKSGYYTNKNLFIESKVNTDEFISRLHDASSNIDIIFSIQPRSLFRKPFIQIAKQNIINLHFAPLPKLRGVATSAWAILDDLSDMGVTLHVINDEGIDNGPIIAQKKFKIHASDNTWSIYNKCVKAGTYLFNSSLNKILAGKYHPVPQNEQDATYHPLGELDFSNLQVDLNCDLEAIDKFIRSRIFPPIQLPYLPVKQKKINIISSKMLPAKSGKKSLPVTVVKKNKNYYITDGKKSILIESYKITK